MPFGIVGSLAASVLLVISLPGFDFDFLAWIALVPLFIVLHGKKPSVAFGYGFVFALAFLMMAFYWISVVPNFKWKDILCVGSYWAIYYGLLASVLAYLSPIAARSILCPLICWPTAWVSIEYLRSHFFFLSLPLNLLGHSQYRNLAVAQIATYSGVYGISFLIVMVNASIAESYRILSIRRDITLHWSEIRRLGVMLVSLSMILSLIYAYGWLSLRQQMHGKAFTATIIQGNIPASVKLQPARLKFNLEQHGLLTRASRRDGATSIVVWPEASVQGILTKDLDLLSWITALSRQTRVPLLVGSATRPKFGSDNFRQEYWHNSAVLISPDVGIEQIYNKIGLLPFAEYLPFEHAAPWPSRLAAFAGRFVPGREYTIFLVQDVRFGVLICSEAMFPEVARQFINKGAELLINIANEAWFGETAAPYQLLAVNVFRAIENRVPVIRSTNTGISCFIDKFGRIVAQVKEGSRTLFVAGFLTQDVILRDSKTFYSRYGDAFSYINILIATVMVLARWLATR